MIDKESSIEPSKTLWHMLGPDLKTENFKNQVIYKPQKTEQHSAHILICACYHTSFETLL